MACVAASPLTSLLDAQGWLVLDGGLATELEARGHDLDHPLWSGRVLLDHPQEVMHIHSAYLQAGADCLISASYQLSHAGLAALGLTAGQADQLLCRSVAVARQAIAEAGRSALVAASIGPYGAYLADGSEYTGAYDLGKSALTRCHRRSRPKSWPV